MLVRLKNGTVIEVEQAKADRLVRKGRATYITTAAKPYVNAMRTAR